MAYMSWLSGICLACAASIPAHTNARPAPSPDNFEHVDIAPHVREASLAFGIPEHWLYALIRQESAGRINAVSAADAMGLMQLMPSTWQHQRARLGLGANPFEPRANILAGASYLREMYDLYGLDGFLAAYNAGPGRYRQWRDKGRPLPAETRAYVAALSAAMFEPHRIFATTTKADMVTRWTSSALFASQSMRVPLPSASPTEPRDIRDTTAGKQPAEGLFARIFSRPVQ